MATRKKQTSEAAVREIRRKTRRRFAPVPMFVWCLLLTEKSMATFPLQHGLRLQFGYSGTLMKSATFAKLRRHMGVAVSGEGVLATLIRYDGCP